MIVVVGGIKGGTGKTTIATNLAVLRSRDNKKVLLVDADEQKSTNTWVNQREALGIETKWVTVQLAGKNTGSEILKLRPNYDDVIVDVGGRETNTLRSSLVVCDIFLIPFRPSSLDVWTVQDISRVVGEMRQANPQMQCYGFINQGDFQGNENRESIEILKEYGEIECLEIIIGYRKSFRLAIGDGKGVCELENANLKAVQEIEDLYNLIYTKCMSGV